MCKQAQIAKDYFLRGFNCAQSAAAAFSGDAGLDESVTLKLASGFGAGIAGRKETCGAVTGMLMAAGLLTGSDAPMSQDEKRTANARLNALVERFADKFGCTGCGDLLARKQEGAGRREYCAGLVCGAAEILAEELGTAV